MAVVIPAPLMRTLPVGALTCAGLIAGKKGDDESPQHSGQGGAARRHASQRARKAIEPGIVHGRRPVCGTGC